MQRIAAWTNLSETTFVLPPERPAPNRYRLRIFTPASELPFAGHPTIGSAHAVLEAGIVSPDGGRLQQECLAGVIDLSVEDGGRIVAGVPSPRVEPERTLDAATVGALLRAEIVTDPAPLAINVGPVWLIAQVASVERLMTLTPDMPAVAEASLANGLSGITVFAFEQHGDARLRLRSFAPAAGIAEDPVCGSGNASVGAYLGATRLLSRTGAAYLASQGQAVGRDGRVAVEVSGRDVTIGGYALTVIDGMLRC
jgi:PhzF family phenazine biosynthesis protein